MKVTVTDQQRRDTLKRTRTEFEGRIIVGSLTAASREYVITVTENDKNLDRLKTVKYLMAMTNAVYHAVRAKSPGDPMVEILEQAALRLADCVAMGNMTRDMEERDSN